jgi:hypothetical protein
MDVRFMVRIIIHNIKDCLSIFFSIGGVISYTTSPSIDKDNLYDGMLEFFCFYDIVLSFLFRWNRKIN